MYLNIHPLIVHFPIALLMTGFLFELIGLFAKKDGFGKFAFILYILGTVGAAAAVISGNFAEDGVGDILGIEHALEEHEQLGTITLWFFVAMTLIRAVLFFKGKFSGILSYIFVAFMLAGMFLLWETAEHGGILVYRYGAGVQHLNLK